MHAFNQCVEAMHPGMPRQAICPALLLLHGLPLSPNWVMQLARLPLLLLLLLLLGRGQVLQHRPRLGWQQLQ
jgi:hypothetical protein